jgi:hypothetical protein
MSSELMGMKAITASIGYPLASLARKNGRKMLSELAEKAFAEYNQKFLSKKKMDAKKSYFPFWSSNPSSNSPSNLIAPAEGQDNSSGSNPSEQQCINPRHIEMMKICKIIFC